MKIMWDRIVRAPFVHAITIAMALSALTAIAAEPQGMVVLLLLIAATCSAILTLVGLQWRGSPVLADSLQESGLYFATGVWLADALLLVFLGAPAGVAVPLLLAAASFIRARTLRGRTKFRIRHVSDVRQKLEYDDRES